MSTILVVVVLREMRSYFQSYELIFSDVADLVLKRTNMGFIILYFSEIQNFQKFVRFFSPTIFFRKKLGYQKSSHKKKTPEMNVSERDLIPPKCS